MKNLLINLSLLAVSTIVTFGLAEVGARRIGIEPDTDRLTTYMFDENIGWVPRKNHRYYRSTPYYAHFNYYDQYGFPTSKDGVGRTLISERPTFALIGDSFAEGYYVPYENSIAGVLEQRLTEFQVVSLGVSGHSPDQTYLYTKQPLEEFNVVNAAILFFPANDAESVMSNTYQGHAKPLFNDPMGQPINTPLNANIVIAQNRSLIQKLLHNSALYSLARPIVKARIATDHKAAIKTEAPHNIEEMKKALQFYQRMQSEHPDVEFTVYYVSPIEELQSVDLYDQNIETYSRLCIELNLRCEALSFPEDRDLEEYYITGDGHFSETGSEHVANLILSQLR